MEAYDTGFGWIKVGKKEYDTDVVLVDLGDGNVRVRERDKSHAEIRYGTSHVIDYIEIKSYLTPWRDAGISLIVIGTGQYGKAELDPIARDKLANEGINVVALPTPLALKKWEESNEKKLGIFHVTC